MSIVADKQYDARSASGCLKSSLSRRSSLHFVHMVSFGAAMLKDIPGRLLRNSWMLTITPSITCTTSQSASMIFSIDFHPLVSVTICHTRLNMSGSRLRTLCKNCTASSIKSLNADASAFSCTESATSRALLMEARVSTYKSSSFRFVNSNSRSSSVSPWSCTVFRRLTIPSASTKKQLSSGAARVAAASVHFAL